MTTKEKYRWLKPGKKVYRYIRANKPKNPNELHNISIPEIQEEEGILLERDFNRAKVRWSPSSENAIVETVEIQILHFERDKELPVFHRGKASKD